MFSPRVMVIKMAHFLYSLLMAAKSRVYKLVNLCPRLLPPFSLYWHKFSRHVTSRLWLVLNGTPNPINHTIFWKNSRRSFRCTQMFCPNCNLFFAVISRKYKAIFDILMTITLEVNIIFSQVTTFFKLVNTGILFLIKFAKFWHITCFFPNLIPIWPQSHELQI